MSERGKGSSWFRHPSRQEPEQTVRLRRPSTLLTFRVAALTKSCRSHRHCRVVRHRTSPVVLDRAAGPRLVRRNGKRGPAESRTAPAIRSAWTPSGSQAARNAVRSADTAIRWTVRSGWSGTLAPQRHRRAADCGRMRAAGKLRACARRGRGYADLPRVGTGMLGAAPPTGVRGAAVTGRRPARPCDQGGGPSHGPATRQRGTEGLSRRAAIYDAARQDDARLSYNQC